VQPGQKCEREVRETAKLVNGETFLSLVKANNTTVKDIQIEIYVEN
jgi:hypothetical protein